MSTKPGWYPSPEDSSVEIYFDGAIWTGEKRDRNANPVVQQGEKSYSFSIPVPSKYLQKKKIIAALVALAVLITGTTAVKAGLDYQSNKKAAAARAAEHQAALEAQIALDKIKNDVTWVPSGYTPWSDDKSIAWKWDRSAGNDCYSCRYWTVEVVSKLGCSGGVYAEMNILQNGTVIDYTNDTLSYLAPGQKGRLSLETYKEGSFTGTLTELTCR
ncbi:Domain of unknown function DUF2510 [Candidatus Nanopelagicaceae bacterium]